MLFISRTKSFIVKQIFCRTYVQPNSGRQESIRLIVCLACQIFVIFECFLCLVRSYVYIKGHIFLQWLYFYALLLLSSSYYFCQLDYFTSQVSAVLSCSSSVRQSGYDSYEHTDLYTQARWNSGTIFRHSSCMSEGQRATLSNTSSLVSHFQNCEVKYRVYFYVHLAKISSEAGTDLLISQSISQINNFSQL